MNWSKDRLRILDANLDRAGEGLRTAEDLARFLLDDRQITEETARIRRDLAAVISSTVPGQLLVGSRESETDVGRAPREAGRKGALDIARAAFRRAEEAARVIEETLRTLQPDAAAKIEDIRFRIYEAEKRLICALARGYALKDARLYLILGEKNAPGRLVEVVQKAVRGGADIIQYREKDLPDGRILDNARRLLEVCREHDVPLIINDRPDIALAVGADGVHVGHEDMPPGEVRSLVGDGMILGFSTHAPDEAAKAANEPVDYIGVGPCFETPTKAGRKAAGLEYVKHAASAGIKIPFFAIGGIDNSNIDQVLAAGASRVAVVRAVAEAEDPEAAARTLKERVAAYLAEKGPE